MPKLKLLSGSVQPIRKTMPNSVQPKLQSRVPMSPAGLNKARGFDRRGGIQMGKLVKSMDTNFNRAMTKSRGLMNRANIKMGKSSRKSAKPRY